MGSVSAGVQNLRKSARANAHTRTQRNAKNNTTQQKSIDYLRPRLHNMHALLIDAQPQRLWQCGSVRLVDLEDRGAIHTPVADDELVVLAEAMIQSFTGVLFVVLQHGIYGFVGLQVCW